MRTRIKICGITRLEDALVAAQAGSDAIGFVFYAKSPRALSLDQATCIRSEVPIFLQTVALVANADHAFVEQVIKVLRPNYVQFHGDETADFCESFAYPYIKAIRIQAQMDQQTVQAVIDEHITASAFLVDSFTPSFGGSGHTFDWKQFPTQQKKKLILSGGLNVTNVVEGIRILKPWAVDVSSSLEEAPGIKSLDKMNAFIRSVQQTDFYLNNHDA